MRECDIWLRYAKSNLRIAREIKYHEEVRYEDLCNQLQQSVEKALKGLLVFFGVSPEKTHYIDKLLASLENLVDIPDYVREANELTGYALDLRYPGIYNDLEDAEEFNRLLTIAEECVRWVEETMKL